MPVGKDRLKAISACNTNRSMSHTLAVEFLGHTPDGHLDKPGIWSNVANSYLTRYGRVGDPADLSEAIRLGGLAVENAPDGHLGKPTWWSNLANNYHTRYQRVGDPADLNEAIRLAELAVDNTPDGHSEQPGWWSNLANRCLDRYRWLGDLADLNEAIRLGGLAAEATPDGHPDQPARWSNLANSYLARYRRVGDPADLDEAIRLYELAVNNTSGGHPEQPGWWSNLSNGYLTRYRRVGDPADLDEAIRLHGLAVDATPNNNPEQPTRWSHLANGYLTRYRRDSDTADVGEVAGLLGGWCEMVAAGSGTFDGVFGNARAWCSQLAGLAADGLVGWGLVAQVGEVVLGRAATTSEGVTAPVGVLWDIRLRLGGVVSLAAFAAVRAGDPGRAVMMLESGSATIARVQASQIDWDVAQHRVPEVAGVALELQARIIHATGTGDLDVVNELTPPYLERVGELRRVLQIPDPQPATLDELGGSGVSHVWVITTPHGGLALRHHHGEIHTIELPDFTTGTVNEWHTLLHPTSNPDDNDSGPGRQPALVSRGDLTRGPVGEYTPVEAAIITVLDAMDHTLAPAAGWLATSDWIIPTGACRSLPWQARHPGRRLHITATHTLTGHQPAVGPVVVFANPTGDLPGAGHEATTLESAGHRAYINANATLTNLAEIPLPASVLHIAAHGTSDPAIWFHGPEPQPLHLGNISEFRHLWAHIGHLILNCCVSASEQHNHHDETMSLATIALTHGTAKTSVALWPLHDEHAAQWATHHHGITPPPNHTPTTTAYLTHG